MEAKIIFSNGVELAVEKNGSSYIVDSKPVFPANLKNVKITSEDGATVVENGQVLECASVDGRYWFTIIEIPKNKLEQTEVQTRLSNIEDALCELSIVG